MSFSRFWLRSTAATLWFAWILTAAAAIDLTPEINDYTAQGEKIQQLAFHEGKLRIDYEPPRNWTFDGNAARLRLRPAKTKFAEAIIEATPLAKPQPLDETVCKALKEKFLAGLPAASQFAKIEQEIANPLLLGGNPTFEVIVSYQVAAAKFCQSALFVNVRDTRLVFYLTALKEDFQALHSEFKSSILSWHWADEKPEAAAPQPPKS